MKKIVFYSLLLTLSLIAKNYAQLSPFGAGLQKYRQGDLEGAIADFESILATDKENTKAKEYLLNCLIASAIKSLQEKEYPKAKVHLERALELSPEDAEVKQLYETAKNKIAEKPTPPQEPIVSPPPVVVPEPVAPKIIEKEKVIKPKPLPPEVPEVKEAKPIVVPKIEKIIEVRKEISPELEEKMAVLLSAFDRERNAFRQYLEQQEEKEKKVRKQFLVLTVSALLAFTFIFLGSLSVNRISPLRTTEIVTSQLQKLKEKERRYRIALQQRKRLLTEIKERTLQEKNELKKHLEEEKNLTQEKLTKQEDEYRRFKQEYLDRINQFRGELEQKNQKLAELAHERENVKIQLMEKIKNQENQIKQLSSQLENLQTKISEKEGALEKFLQEKNILNRQLEERTRQMEEEKERLKLQIVELKRFSETQFTEMKERFLEEEVILTKEFEEKIKETQQEKEKMLQQISGLQKINQGLENQLKEYLKEKKQRREEFEIILPPLSQQREDLLQYLRQWKTRQRNETIAHRLRINTKFSAS